MILKALYDYYYRSDDLPSPGMEEKEIAFILVLTKEGEFVRFEDGRIDKNHAKSYLVKKHVWGIERSGFFSGREKWVKSFENQRA